MSEDNEEAEETTEDQRFTRVVSDRALVFERNIEQLRWQCWEAYDELNGRECHWHKLHVGERGSQGPTAKQVYRDLLNWARQKHPLLLSLNRIWLPGTHDVEFIASSCGSHNMREYIRIHQQLGEPAKRKIGRQLVKAIFQLKKAGFMRVLEHLRSTDVYIRAGNAQICVLPSFLWRQEAQPADGPVTTSPYSSCRSWSALILELYLAQPMHTLTSSELAVTAQDAEVPPLARDLVLQCLNLGSETQRDQILKLSHLLEHPWLNTRQLILDPNCISSPLGPSPREDPTEASSRPDVPLPVPPPLPLPVLRVRPSPLSVSSTGQHTPVNTHRFSAVDTARPGGKQMGQEILRDFEADDADGVIKAGVLMGEHYQITVVGAVQVDKPNILFTVKLQRLAEGTRETVDDDYLVLSFPYDILHDNIRGVTLEMADSFKLGGTDTELMASAMKEVIGQQVPGLERLESVSAALTHSARFSGTLNSAGHDASDSMSS